MTIYIQFPDKLVSYETFMDDLSARVERLLKNDANDKEYISQRTAYAMFGRGNVERWRRQGRVVPCERPGKTEYRTADLRLLQRIINDKNID